MALAWEKISQMSEGKTKRELDIFYEKKRDGYTALMHDDPVSAYYIFSSLMKEYPGDVDVKKYYALSRDAVEKVSFFADEVDQLSQLPGRYGIFFMNSSNPSGKEFIYLSKLTEYRGQLYAEGVEAIAFSSEGKVLYHLSAPYGKFQEGYLFLRAVDRNDSRRQFLPVFLEGSRESSPRFALELSVKPDILQGLSPNGTAFHSLSIAQLWKLSQVSEGYGYRAQLVELEIMERLIKIFGFLILSFFSIGIGWLLKSNYYPRPPLFLFAVIPLLPFAVYFCSQIYFYGHRLLAGVLLLVSGFTAACAVLSLLEAFLFFLALLVISKQMVKRG